MSAYAWLATIKPGDMVIVNDGGWGNTSRVTRVTRLTATQIVIQNGHAEQRFRRSDGHVVGGTGYHSAWLSEPTPQRVAEVRRAALRSRVFHAIRALDVKKSSDEQIEALARVLGIEVTP